MAVERIAKGQYKMQCETIGTAGNTLFGTLIPIEYIRGLSQAELTELLIPGEDEKGRNSSGTVILIVCIHRHLVEI